MIKRWIGLALSVIALLVMFASVVRAEPDSTYDPLPPISNGLPTVPPPLPTYVVNGDGSRMNCTPTLSYCWPSP